MPKADGGKTIETVGEIFPDGRHIEIVADPADRSRSRLLYWNGHSAKIGSRFEHRGHIYRPAELSRSFLLATRLPVRQGRQMHAAKLFAKVSTEFRRSFGLHADDADRITLFCLSTWFPEVLPVLPSLWISGMDATYGIQVMRLVACFCRRPLLLGAAARSAWGFIADTRPTLLVFDVGVSPIVEPALQASNYRGLCSVDGRGVHDFCCSKAVFSLANGVDPSLVESGVLPVSLGAERAQALGLADHELDKVSDEFQPMLLTYRLANSQRVRKSRCDFPEFTFPTRATAAALGACVCGDPRLTARLIALLKWQDEAARAERCMDPHSSLIEVLLGLTHRALGKNDDRAGSVAVQELTNLLNGLVRSRGGIREFSAEEIGWMLKKLGVPKTRSAAGMQISLCDQTARRVHRLALSYGVSTVEPRGVKCPACPACEGTAQSAGYAGYVGGTDATNPMGINCARTARVRRSSGAVTRHGS